MIVLLILAAVAAVAAVVSALALSRSTPAVAMVVATVLIVAGAVSLIAFRQTEQRYIGYSVLVAGVLAAGAIAYSYARPRPMV